MTVVPSNQSVDATGTATFYAVVRGVYSDMFTYQWGQSRRNIPGSNGPVLTISNAQRKDAGQFRCVVENTDGRTVISDRVRLSTASK